MDSSSYEHDEEKQGFLDLLQAPEQRVALERNCWGNVRWCLRLVMEVLMAIAIAVLATRSIRDQEADELRPVPKFPRKTYTFNPNPRYVREDMFASRDTLYTLHNWIELSADGRGYTQIENADRYNLSEPFTVAINHLSDGPAYMISVFHQLHCLSYLVQHFQTAFDGTDLSQEVAHHSAHCFDYLRQSIMCAADTNLEGKTEAGPGWGSEHLCADYDAVLAWANEHSALKWRKNMPAEAVL